MRMKPPRLREAAVTAILADRVLRGGFSGPDDGEAAFSTAALSAFLGQTAASEATASVSVRNDADKTLQLRELALSWPASYFDESLDARDYVQLHHFRDFSSLSGIRPVHRPADWSPAAESSGMVTVLSRRRDGDCVLLGALPPYGDCFVDIDILHEEPHRDGAFGFGFRLLSPRSIEPGETVDLAHLAVLVGEDGNRLLTQYAELVRERLSTLNFEPPPARVGGWNSWDYYAGAVGADDVLVNAAEARARFADTLNFIVIDEGYECQWGVWEAGWKFPLGLADACARIRSEGYEPGIWTAPLMVSVYTPLYREHPDWFVGDEKGNAFLTNTGYGAMAQLDITHPDVEVHIRERFARLRAAGFSYFKCDFVQLLLGASTFRSPVMSHAGMIRRLFGTIREAIGKGAYLLACGAPYEATIGIADAHRTTGDIHNYWSHIRQNVRSMLARWWMQGAIGNTDPDFAIVRCGETTDDTRLNRRLAKNPWGVGANWTAGREMNLTEAKTLLLACYVTGGDLILGDALKALNGRGILLLSRILREPVRRGIPTNLFEPDGDELPIVVAESGDPARSRRLLALFNLGDDHRMRTIPADYLTPSCVWTAFWTGEAVPSPPTGKIELAPRSAEAWWIEIREIASSTSCEQGSLP